MMGTVLVTGGNGFIARNVVRALAERGWNVKATIRRPEQVRDLASIARCVQVPDIGPGTEWAKTLSGVEAIVHLAARAHLLRDTADDPLALFRRVNTQGTLRLASEAARAGVKRFVYVSSIGVNGSLTETGIFSECDRPKPDSFYAISKWEAEKGLIEIQEETGMEVVVIRPPLVYGAGAPGNLRRLVRLIYLGVPIPLASVRNKRSFIGVDNLADVLGLCVEHPRAGGQTFLVADGEDLSTPQVIRYLADGLDCDARIWPFPAGLLRIGAEFVGKRAIFNSLCGSLQINTGKVCSLLDWQPKVPISEGLVRAAAWYRKSWDD